MTQSLPRSWSCLSQNPDIFWQGLDPQFTIAKVQKLNLSNNFQILLGRKSGKGAGEKEKVENEVIATGTHVDFLFQDAFYIVHVCLQDFLFVSFLLGFYFIYLCMEYGSRSL